jgi:preprotein translocase subunit SecF
MEEKKGQSMEKTRSLSRLYDKTYKFLLFIPFILTLISLIYLGSFFSNHGDFIYKDTTLSGGTTITLNGNIDSGPLESKLKPEFPDISIRKLTDIRTHEPLALIIESSSPPENLKAGIEKILGYNLTEENSSTEFSGPALSQGFYKQLIIALIIAFLLISIVVFILFRTLVPSIATIFSVFSDIVMALAIVDFLGLRLSTAGIAAFLMLIGYSVDDNILLTTRALKNKENTLNERLFRAFKTGLLMTLTAIAAVLPAFFIVSGLPDSFRQIFLVLAFGLFADIINTWVTNAGIIKWYCEKRGIN